VAYVIPFVFVYEPSLIMQGSFIEIILCFSSALIGIWVVSAGMLGYVFSKIGPVIRVVCIISGLILILPVTIIPYGAVIKVVAAGAVCIILGLELVHNKRLVAED